MPTFCLLSLWTGTTFTFFHVSGNLPFLRDCLKIIFKGKISDWLQIFIILIDILSQPWALLGYYVSIISGISFSITWKEWILFPVLYDKGGKQLAISIVVHIEAKKLLKTFAFSKNLKQSYHRQVQVVLLGGGVYYRENGLI